MPRPAQSHVLPAKAWREIMQRAATLGMVAELLAGGTEVRFVASRARRAGPPAAIGRAGTDRIRSSVGRGRAEAERGSAAPGRSSTTP